MSVADEQLRFFKARAERLKDERDQLRVDVAYQSSTILMLTDEKAALEKRIDELCQEVERLRQELAIREASEQEKYIDYLRHENVDWEDKYRSVVAENAKLRELVNGLEHCSQGFPCNTCSLYNSSDPEHRRCESLERELGIEVTA